MSQPIQFTTHVHFPEYPLSSLFDASETDQKDIYPEPSKKQPIVVSPDGSFISIFDKEAKRIIDLWKKSKPIMQFLMSMGIHIESPDPTETYLKAYEKIFFTVSPFPKYDLSGIFREMNLLCGKTILENTNLLSSWMHRIEAISMIYVIEHKTSEGKKLCKHPYTTSLIHSWKESLLQENVLVDLSNNGPDDLFFLEKSFELYNRIFLQISEWAAHTNLQEELLCSLNEKRKEAQLSTIFDDLHISELNTSQESPTKEESASDCAAPSTATSTSGSSGTPEKGEQSTPSIAHEGHSPEPWIHRLPIEDQKLWTLNMIDLSPKAGNEENIKKCLRLFETNESLKEILHALEILPSPAYGYSEIALLHCKVLCMFYSLGHDLRIKFNELNSKSFLNDLAMNSKKQIYLISELIDMYVSAEAFQFDNTFPAFSFAIDYSLNLFHSFENKKVVFPKKTLRKLEIGRVMNLFFQHTDLMAKISRDCHLDFTGKSPLDMFSIIKPLFSDALRNLLPSKEIPFLAPDDNAKYEKILLSLIESCPHAIYTWIYLYLLQIDGIPKTLFQQILYKGIPMVLEGKRHQKQKGTAAATKIDS